jgi:transcriptional regulator with XRE-family HTH domain
MKTFGELIAEGRKRAKLTQRELAARIKLEDGRPISPPYLNDLEHNLRKPPRGHLIEQFAKELAVEPDLLYFAAGRMPAVVEPSAASEDEVLAAYRAFRKEFKSKGKKR